MEKKRAVKYGRNKSNCCKRKCRSVCSVLLHDSLYKPKEALEECDINERREGREVQEGGDVHTAVSQNTIIKKDRCHTVNSLI